jgi:hypothetical protein
MILAGPIENPCVFKHHKEKQRTCELIAKKFSGILIIGENIYILSHPMNNTLIFC